MRTSRDHAALAPTAAQSTMTAGNDNPQGTSTVATQPTTALTTLEAQSTPEHLQRNVTVGCTTLLTDIARPLNISAIKVGQVLDALHLRDWRVPTQEAISRGLGNRFFNGCQFLVEWQISGVTEVVTAYYDAIGWPSKPISKVKAATPPCRVRRCAGYVERAA